MITLVTKNTKKQQKMFGYIVNVEISENENYKSYEFNSQQNIINFLMKNQNKIISVYKIKIINLNNAIKGVQSICMYADEFKYYLTAESQYENYYLITPKTYIKFNINATDCEIMKMCYI